MSTNESKRLIINSKPSSESSATNIPPSSPSKRMKRVDSWSATPGIRQNWFKGDKSSVRGADIFSLIGDHHEYVEVSEKEVSDLAYAGISTPEKESLYGDPPYGTSSKPNLSSETTTAASSSTPLHIWFQALTEGINLTPGVLIAIILNLFLSTSFGLAFFPSDFQFPGQVPRAIGVQMFLFATFISQIVLTHDSDFKAPIGMMMVENIPFMHAICDLVSKSQSNGYDVMATVLFTYAISSIVVGIFFYVLGKFKLGNIVYFFPKHVIVGCIGGIGIFIFQTGMEAATAKPWEWRAEYLMNYLSNMNIAQYWMISLAFELLLRVLAKTRLNGPLLPPFFFISIPPVFYLALLILEIPVSQARANGWFFEAAENVNPMLMWELMDVRKVDWTAVASTIPTILALTIFSLMHVPINIPSLSLSVKQRVDMNNELKAHGISNMLSGLLGGLQNYLCYSNSLLYFKCNGHGKIAGYIVALLVGVFFVIGPSMVEHVPRCMAGCLLMHVGIDLSKEALYDSRRGLDSFEYYSVVLITLVMTFYGMTAGLGFGIICATITFTLQVSNHLAPIRGMMRASTLRSSKWRSFEAMALVDKLSRHVLVVQLQGQLFFGNATTMASEVEDILLEDQEAHEIQYLILDFTLVLSIDSSAAETISSIFEICKKYNVKLCYSRPSNEGFPCAVELSERLHEIASQSNPDAKKSSVASGNGASASSSALSSPSKDMSHQSNYVDLEDGLQAFLSTSPIGNNQSAKKRLSSGPSVPTAIMRNNGFLLGSQTRADDRGEHDLGYELTSYQAIDQNEIKIDMSASSSMLRTSSYDELIAIRKRFLGQQMHVADSLDSALTWCEDQLLTAAIEVYDYTDPFKYSSTLKSRPPYLKQLYALCPADVPIESIDRLISYFEHRYVSAGEVLWKQGEESDRALILASGRLIHTLEEEAGTMELIDIGHLVGEYGLLSGQRRYGTLTAIQASNVYVLTADKYKKMTMDDPFISLVLARICLGYLGHRAQHVSNRIW
jgi:sulfate permease, SulP family